MTQQKKKRGMPGSSLTSEAAFFEFAFTLKPLQLLLFQGQGRDVLVVLGPG